MMKNVSSSDIMSPNVVTTTLDDGLQSGKIKSHDQSLEVVASHGSLLVRQKAFLSKKRAAEELHAAKAREGATREFNARLLSAAEALEGAVEYDVLEPVADPDAALQRSSDFQAKVIGGIVDAPAQDLELALEQAAVLLLAGPVEAGGGRVLLGAGARSVVACEGTMEPR